MPAEPGQRGRMFEDSAFRRRVLEEAESRIMATTGNTREAMIALDENGLEVLSKVGNASEIGFTRDEVRLLATRAYVVIHNHDDDTPPSIEDLAFMAVVTPAELVTFGPSTRWRLLRGTTWPPTRRLFQVFNQVDHLVMRELVGERQAGRFSGDPYLWADRSIAVWQRLQREFPGWLTLLREER